MSSYRSSNDLSDDLGDEDTLDINSDMEYFHQNWLFVNTGS